MNLLAYTKKISEKIRYYDRVSKKSNSDIYASNPFAKPINLTIVWVDNNCDKKD